MKIGLALSVLISTVPDVDVRKAGEDGPLPLVPMRFSGASAVEMIALLDALNPTLSPPLPVPPMPIKSICPSPPDMMTPETSIPQLPDELAEPPPVPVTEMSPWVVMRIASLSNKNTPVSSPPGLVPPVPCNVMWPVSGVVPVDLMVPPKCMIPWFEAVPVPPVPVSVMRPTTAEIVVVAVCIWMPREPSPLPMPPVPSSVISAALAPVPVDSMWPPSCK